jgi:hypothetical protein
MRPTEWPAPVAGARLDPLLPPLSEARLTPDNAVYWLRQIEWPTGGFANLPAAERDRFHKLGIAGAPYPAHEAAIAAMRPQFDLWTRAAACPQGRHPTVDSIAGVVVRLAGIVALARLECVRAETAWAGGRRAEAAASVARVLRNTDAIARGGPVLHQLVRMSAQGEILRSVRRMALATGSPADLSLLEEAARTVHPSPSDLAEAMRNELAFIRSGARRVYSSPNEVIMREAATAGEAAVRGLVLRGLFRFTRMAGSTPEATLAHVDAVYSHIVSTFEGTHNPGAMEKTLAFLDRPRGGLTALTDDPIGRLLVNVTAPGINRMWRRAAAAQAAAEATRAVIRVQQFLLEHGTLPGDLTRIPGLSEDPFAPAGGMMTFERDGSSWAIRSAGKPNGETEGPGLVFGPAEFR